MKNIKIELKEENTKDFYCDFVLTDEILVNKVYEDQHILAYFHTKPSWPVHIVVLPKQHIDSLLECDLEMLSSLLVVIKNIAKDIMINHGACRILTNLGTYQDSQHLHWHLYVE